MLRVLPGFVVAPVPVPVTLSLHFVLPVNSSLLILKSSMAKLRAFQQLFKQCHFHVPLKNQVWQSKRAWGDGTASLACPNTRNEVASLDGSGIANLDLDSVSHGSRQC